MHLLVTGGAGFIGSNFVSQTLRAQLHPGIPKGVRITVLDLLTYASGHEFIEADIHAYPDRCRLVRGSILDRDLVFDFVNESDAIVHFAAESHNDNALHDPTLFIETNVSGTLNLLEAAREYDKRFHHVSTDEVYGDLPLLDPAQAKSAGAPAQAAQGQAAEGNAQMRRTSAPAQDPSAPSKSPTTPAKFTEHSPYRPSSPYSASKASADHLVNAWVRSFGLNATISNCSNNYGPRQHVKKLIPRTITERLQGRRPRVYGTGANVRDWIHVDDHNRGIWDVLLRGRAGNTYLIGANGEASNLEVVRTINELMGFPANDIEYVKDRPGHDLRYAIDASKIETELGWRPQHTNFRAGLNETIEWYEKNRAWWEPSKTATEARLSKWGY